MIRLRSLIWVAAGLFGAAGCTPLHTGVRHGPSPDATLAQTSPTAAAAPTRHAPPIEPPIIAPAPPPLPRWAQNPPLSPGDRLRVEIEDGDGFRGRYEVGIDGTLHLPHLPPLPVAGSDTRHAAALVREALVAAHYFKPHRVRVSVLVHEWSHVQVHVGGAVFAPGMVSVNVRSPEERALKSDLAAGDFPSERMLTAALRAAGGVRPDAAVDRILLIRDEHTQTVSYAGLIDGAGVPQVPLMSGDRIVVESSGRFDAELVVPSAITPPGIRVFLSNLTVPATGNAISAVSKEASSLPYGSRLLTAAVSANCVGGVNATSASRHAVLVRTDPISGQAQALERPIHELLRSPGEVAVNPYVMPNDSIACYDSGVTNLRDIARAIADVLLPIVLL